MKIYHGGTDIIKIPQILPVNRGRDFGIGFYATTIETQAKKWAKRQAINRRKETAFLNVYEYNSNQAENELKIKNFSKYTLEWLDLVIACRQDGSYNHGYDIVTGKIADDDVGETVQAVIDGLSSRDFALSKLVFMPANDQICFCSNKSLAFLDFIKSQRVN